MDTASSPAGLAGPLRGDAQAGHPLIDRVEDLTPQWLTAVLRAADRLDGARVIEAHAGAVGNGMMALTVRLKLRYDAPAPRAPATLVAKLPATQPQSRQTSVQMGAYLREVRFYQDVAPALPDAVARALFADIDAQGERFCLLFDDLAPARGGDQITGCDLADAQTAMDTAAALHAPLWGSPRLDTLGWLNRDGAVQLYCGGYHATHQATAQRYGATLTPEQCAVIADLAPRIERYYADPPRPWTVTHQDFRLDNLLFEARGGAVPLAVLDWQTVRTGPGVSDVAYFIGAGLDTPARREHERALLQRYLRALQRLGVHGLSEDAAWAQYRLFAAEGLITAVIAGAMVTPTERGDRMFTAMLGRHAQHMLDLDTLSLIR